MIDRDSDSYKLGVAEAELRRLRVEAAPTPAEAWAVVKRWLDSYQEEEATFSVYRDDVILDGVMTAGKRRALSAFLRGGDGEIAQAVKAERDKCISAAQWFCNVESFTADDVAERIRQVK